MSQPRALIAGLGAIGASIGMALRASGWYVLYFDRHEFSDTRGAADARGNLEDPVDVTILATPEDVALELLPRTRGLVTSVCSVMTPLRSAAGGEFVAGHPMTGTEQAGIDAASRELFAQKPSWFIDREHPVVRRMIEDCGASAELVDAEEHDRAMALVSHLPQVLSTALASYLDDKRDMLRFSAGGLRTFLRLAGMGSEMWSPILAENRNNIAPHAAAVMQIVREMLEGEAEPHFEHAQAAYRFLTK